MSYVPGTVLKRTTPFTDKDGPKDEDLTVYNEVKVIGPSPVTEAGRAGEWEGQDGNGTLIQPISFGATLDRPFGELQRDYDVVSIPKLADVRVVPPPVRETPGLSPEQKFAQDAASAD